MSLISLLITLAVVGFLVWLITTYIPMSPGFKRAIIVVAIVVIALWLLKVFGLMGRVDDVRVGQAHSTEVHRT
jgi:hypothetical protein